MNTIILPNEEVSIWSTADGFRNDVWLVGTVSMDMLLELRWSGSYSCSDAKCWGGEDNCAESCKLIGLLNVLVGWWYICWEEVALPSIKRPASMGILLGPEGKLPAIDCGVDEE